MIEKKHWINSMRNRDFMTLLFVVSTCILQLSPCGQTNDKYTSSIDQSGETHDVLFDKLCVAIDLWTRTRSAESFSV